MKAIAGIIILIALVMGADWLLLLLKWTVPSAVVVMACLVLFLLYLGRVPTVLDAGAGLLFRLFPLFFIPPLVMVVSAEDLVFSYPWVLLFSITASSFLSLFVAALLYRFLAKSGNKAEVQK